MNTAKRMKSHSYDRLAEPRHIDARAKTDQDLTIIRIPPKSVSAAFMPLKPAFSTAC
jgi:hypothetical protein